LRVSFQDLAALCKGDAVSARAVGAKKQKNIPAASQDDDDGIEVEGGDQEEEPEEVVEEEEEELEAEEEELEEVEEKELCVGARVMVFGLKNATQFNGARGIVEALEVHTICVCVYMYIHIYIYTWCLV